MEVKDPYRAFSPYFSFLPALPHPPIFLRTKYFSELLEEQSIMEKKSSELS